MLVQLDPLVDVVVHHDVNLRALYRLRVVRGLGLLLSVGQMLEYHLLIFCLGQMPSVSMLLINVTVVRAIVIGDFEVLLVVVDIVGNLQDIVRSVDVLLSEVNGPESHLLGRSFHYFFHWFRCFHLAA